MNSHEHEFTPDGIDEQVAAFAQLDDKPPLTPNSQAIASLQRFYVRQTHENVHSLARVEQRLLRYEAHDTYDETDAAALPLPELRGEAVATPHWKSRFGRMTQTIAAFVIVAVLGAGFFIFFRVERDNGIGAGPSFHVVTSPSRAMMSNYLWSVSASARNDVWAVGESMSSSGTKSQILIEHWDGKQWSQSAAPSVGNVPSLEGIAAVASDDAWAVGGAGLGSHASDALVEHWNGKQWSVAALPDPHAAGSFLWGVAAVSANDVWAVGGTNDSAKGGAPLIEHWDGKRWEIVSSPKVPLLQGTLHSVAVIAANDVWAVGGVSNNDPSNRSVDRALVEHWDGARWSIVPMPNLAMTEGSLADVAASSANDIWMTGWQEALTSQGHLQAQPLLEHWNGRDWQSVPNRAGPDDSLWGVTAIAGNDVWAVGAAQIPGQVNTLIEHWDGIAWTIVPSQNASAQCENELNSVTVVPNTTRIWAVGEYGVGCHTKGQFSLQTLIETAAT